jgi:hypothetical protein
MISAVFQRFLGMLPLVLRVAVVTEIAVPTMTYLLDAPDDKVVFLVAISFYGNDLTNQE